MAKLIDAHNHSFNDLSRSDEVCLMLSCAAKSDEFKALENVAAKDKRIIPCFGVHPWYSNNDFNLDELRYFLENNPKSLVGEIGLDKIRKLDFTRQREVFVKQLSLGIELNKAVVLHCVKSYDDMINILSEYQPKAFLLHSYSGSSEHTKKFTALGGYFSFGTKLLKEDNRKVAESLKFVPLDRLLLETDAPDMPINKGEANFPDNIKMVYAKTAELLGLRMEKLEAIINNNVRRFLL